MAKAVLKGSAFILAHAPDMVLHNGTTQTTERITNPDSDYLKAIGGHIRSFSQAVGYAPNQTYIGGMTPQELSALQAPWHDKLVSESRYGKYGELMPQDEFIGLMQIVDSFDLVRLEKEFAALVKQKLSDHELFVKDAALIKEGAEIDVISAQINEQHAEGLYHDGKLVGCVKKAHDIDINLNAHVIFENLVAKASGVLAFKNLIAKSNINVTDIDYVIECSEEACGDMNQRGGGNFAKAIAEKSGAVNATGSDTRGFCAAPTHALIQAASLVAAGTYKNVVVVAGGATAKLGMNGKDHVKKNLPVLEDVIGGFATLVGCDDKVSPVFNTGIVGRHTVGTGSSPQAVINSLVFLPLDNAGLKISDVDKYSVEMQNAEITKPAGAGDVPEANYKMIAALAVMKKEMERSKIEQFIKQHGMVGWAPTQGHIPSGVPYLGFARDELTDGTLNRVMIIGKGSLFLGRMTNLFDGVSIVLERNSGDSAAEEQPVIKPAAKKRIGLTLLGSEHGVENLVKGAELAHSKDKGFDIVLIGPRVKTSLEVIEVSDEKQMYSKMEELIDSGYISGCVTMHYNFPIGVSTVGKIITPGCGREMFLATTTGTSSANRVEAMIKNALHGVAAARATGIERPSVGVLNLDGARQVERALSQLVENGYDIELPQSTRSDGGTVMRGNDLLLGNADVMVTDTLTGNILMKVFSAYTTGGSYESSGFGYGPGIGKDYSRLILILSRASGIPVVANALLYASALADGDVCKLSNKEYAKAENAGLSGILAKLSEKKAPAQEANAPVVAPAKEVVTEEITGIDIMELEDAVEVLLKNNVYAESGMGCTGPVILVNPDKAKLAAEILVLNSFLTGREG